MAIQESKAFEKSIILTAEFENINNDNENPEFFSPIICHDE